LLLVNEAGVPTTPASFRESTLCSVLDLVVLGEGEAGEREALSRHRDEDQAWGLGLASYCAFIHSSFGQAADLAERALQQSVDQETRLLAQGAMALASAGPSGASDSVPLDDLLAEGMESLEQLEGGVIACFLRYLFAEAALATARVSLAAQLAAGADSAAAQWTGPEGKEHSFVSFIRINRVRAFAFAGRIDAARAAHELLVANGPNPDTAPMLALVVEATGILVQGNAAERSQVRTLADRLAGVFPEPKDYLSSGAWLLVAFGLDAAGEVRRAARFALTAAGGDPDAPRLTIIDRVLLLELLVKQAAVEGDLDAAEAWCAHARTLADNPIANSTVSRIQARVDLLAGRVGEAELGAERAVEQAREVGRAIEVSEGELVMGQIQIALSMPGEARKRLEQTVLRSDAEGHLAVRASARRLLRGGGQRLRPSPGSEWDGLSTREREVALLVAHGLSNIAIASELHISANTVRVHVSRVLAAFGASSRFAVMARIAELLPSEGNELAPLTSRQVAVAERIAKGYGNAEIAQDLGVSKKTVEKHITDICRAWQTSSRLGVARLVIGGGLQHE
jgi:DNA-binding NarL/FixJ family response regulator